MQIIKNTKNYSDTVLRYSMSFAIKNLFRYYKSLAEIYYYSYEGVKETAPVV